MGHSDSPRFGALLPRRYELISSLSPDEVFQRLNAAVASEWSFFSDKPFRGTVDRQSFRIRPNIRYRNSFQTHLYGSLHAEGGQTRVRCTARMHTFVVFFMAIWFGLTISVGGPIILYGVGAVLTGQLTGVPSFTSVIPPMMLLFGVALVLFCRWVARDEEAELIRFMEETIEA